MPFVEYSEIEGLIDHAEQDGGRMKVYFRCPKSGEVVEASGTIPRTMRHYLATEAKQGALRHVLAMIRKLIKDLTGIYIATGSASSVAAGGKVAASESDKMAGIVAAFESVAEYPGKPQKPKRFNFINDAWVYLS